MAISTQQSSFIFVCLILALVSNNYCTLAQSNATLKVTGSLISLICSNRRNTRLCEKYLAPFKRHVITKPLTTLVTEPMAVAVNVTRKLNNGVRSFPKKIYDKCSFIKKQIEKASRLALKENSNGVRFSILAAVHKAVEVERTLGITPPQRSYIVKEIAFLRDVLDVIIAVCDKLSSSNYDPGEII